MTSNDSRFIRWIEIVHQELSIMLSVKNWHIAKYQAVWRNSTKIYVSNLFRILNSLKTNYNPQWQVKRHTSSTSWKSVETSKFYKTGNTQSVSFCWKTCGICSAGCRNHPRGIHTSGHNTHCKRLVRRAVQIAWYHALEETWTSVAVSPFSTATQRTSDKTVDAGASMPSSWPATLQPWLWPTDYRLIGLLNQHFRRRRFHYDE